MENRNACVAKSTLLLLLLVMWVSAGAFIFIGAYSLHLGGDISNVAKSSHVFIPATASLALGIFIFSVGLLGCLACTLDNKPMLTIFFSLLILVFLGQIATLICGVVYRSQLNDKLNSLLFDDLDQYDKDIPIHNEVDFIQEHFKCCGVNNASDWLNTGFYKTNGSYPDSCCKGGTCKFPKEAPLPSFLDEVNEIKNDIMNIFAAATTTAPLTTTSEPDGHLFTTGCLTQLEDFFKTNMSWIVAITCFFLINLFTGMVSTAVILCRSSNEVRYEQFGIISDGLTV